METIIAAIIGFLGVVITSILSYKKLKIERAKTDQARNELSLQSAGLDFSAFVAEWHSVQEDINSLLNETCIDRFLILRAWNGKYEPKWTSAIFQVRQGLQSPMNYVHFELDDDYVNRLRETIHHGHIYFTTDEICSSAIKDVYSAEEIKSSLWHYISETKLLGGDGVAITYCSFATHQDGGIPDHVQTRCRVLANRLSGIARSFEPFATSQS